MAQQAFIKFPFSLKFIYLCRHLANTQNLFLKWEKRCLDRLHVNARDLPKGRVLPVREFTPDTFDAAIIKSMSRRETFPIVIRGFADPDLLTLENLSSNYGNAMVPVHPNANLKSGAIYRSLTHRPLADVIEDIESGKSIYTVAATEIFGAYPELSEHTQTSRIEKIAQVDIIKDEFFIGAAKTGSNFHAAPADNYFLMVQGRKLWRLIDPRNSLAMYPTFGRQRESAAVISPITSKDYDPGQYPLFEKIDIYEVELQPGDLLYNPTMWWHEVENFDATIGAPHRVVPRSRYDFTGLIILLRMATFKYYTAAFRDLIRGKNSKVAELSDTQVMTTYGGQPKKTL